MSTTNPSSSHEPENHKLSDDDPGVETDPLPHYAHDKGSPDGDDDEPEARMSSDDMVALDEDDLVYAEGPDA